MSHETVVESLVGKTTVETLAVRFALMLGLPSVKTDATAGWVLGWPSVAKGAVIVALAEAAVAATVFNPELAGPSGVITTVATPPPWLGDMGSAPPWKTVTVNRPTVVMSAIRGWGSWSEGSVMIWVTVADDSASSAPTTGKDTAATAAIKMALRRAPAESMSATGTGVCGCLDVWHVEARV